VSCLSVPTLIEHAFPESTLIRIRLSLHTDIVMIFTSLKHVAIAVSTLAAMYIGLLGLLTTPWFQAHVVYLHAISMTWFKDLNVPEVFGFLHNQVTPLNIQSGAPETLYTLHTLPVELYRQHEDELLAQPSGFVKDWESRLTFRLLLDGSDARLVIHFHDAGGTVGSGYRTPNYRAVSAGQPDKIHVLTFDYRGFGRTPGTPTEEEIITDALAVVNWALNVASIPPSRILIFSQSLGTAVNTAVAEHYALQIPAVCSQDNSCDPFHRCSNISFNLKYCWNHTNSRATYQDPSCVRLSSLLHP